MTSPSTSIPAPLAHIWLDPGFLEPDHQCQGCRVRRGAHVHHREHKAMGGRHGAARVRSEAASNKILLCATCHDASHLIHSYAPDGFCCERCPKLERCWYGLKTLGQQPPEGMVVPW